MNERTPVMEGKHITVRFGPGCPYCQEHTDLEKGRCPCAAPFGACVT